LATQTGSPRESRTPLSRERVLRAAVGLADQAGIDSLSMRRLAQELGVEAMSLYHYFARKDDLLSGMLETVYSEIESPSGGGDWRAAMRSSAISFHHVLLRHPWACGLLGALTGMSETRFRHMDTVLGRLREAGFSAKLTHHAYHALDSHIVGFTLWVLPYLAIARDQPDFAEQAFQEMPLDQLPHLAEHIRYHIEVDEPGETSEFEFGLDLLLDGLEKLRDGD
jgi:AcrR family transcriptional regulator